MTDAEPVITSIEMIPESIEGKVANVLLSSPDDGHQVTIPHLVIAAEGPRQPLNYNEHLSLSILVPIEGAQELVTELLRLCIAFEQGRER